MNVTETERLVFRLWSQDLAPLAEKLWADKDVMFYLMAAQNVTPENAHARLQKEIESQLKCGISYWPVFEKATDRFVGCCGLRPWVYTPDEATEMGFHLMPDMWGKGYATEAAIAVRNLAQERGIKMLMAGRHPENRGSHNVLLKIGFQPAGETFYPPTGLMHPIYKLHF